MGKDNDPDVDFYGKGVHADVEEQKRVDRGERGGNCAIAFFFIASAPIWGAYLLTTFK